MIYFLGRIGIVDYDTVEISNLHRQVIHQEGSVGVMKSISARDALKRFFNLSDIYLYYISLNI